MSENKQTPEAKDFEIIYFFIGCFIGLGFHIFYLTCWKIFTKKALEASPGFLWRRSVVYQNQNRSGRQDSGFPLCGLGLGPYIFLSLFPPLQNGHKCYIYPFRCYGSHCKWCSSFKRTITQKSYLYCYFNLFPHLSGLGQCMQKL